MVSQDSLLVTLVQRVDGLPLANDSAKGGRGHSKFYSDRVFLKAFVIMIVRHLHTVHELLTVLEQPTVATQCFVLGAVFVYQLGLLYRFENSLDPSVGLKAFLKAA